MLFALAGVCSDMCISLFLASRILDAGIIGLLEEVVSLALGCEITLEFGLYGFSAKFVDIDGWLR